MKRLFSLLLVLALSAPAFAQTMGDDTMDPDDRTYRSDLERLERDIGMLDRDARADMRADLDGFRQSYDELRQIGDTSTDMSDPAAVRQSRMDRGQRYDDLSGRVYRARLDAAGSRDAYVRTALDRADAYDAQIDDLRTRYDAASGDDRGRYAQDLIRLRNQRDAYRQEVLRTRGMLRGDFDGNRRQATDTLARYDTDFMRARRDAMTQMDGMDTMDDSGM